MSSFQASLQEFAGLSHPVIDSRNFNASLHSLDLKIKRILKFNLTIAVTDKKINLAKEKHKQNKYHFFANFWAKRTHYDSISLLYAILVGTLLVLLLIQIGII